MVNLSRCVCQECGDPYFVVAKEFKVVPTMRHRPYRANDSQKAAPMKTWMDWVEHCMNHCEECRLEEVPMACKMDYDKHEAMSREDVQPGDTVDEDDYDGWKI
jgi:hypothetical protein